MSFSAYFDGGSRDVTWLISRHLDATCALVLSDPAGRLCVLDITIKDKAFRQIGVYGPNVTSELPAFFRRIEPYVVLSKRVILVGDWNAVLDPNLDGGAISASTNPLDARYFCDFVEQLDLVDKFRERHPNKIAWTWIGRGASAQLYSYLDRVLVKRVDLDYLGGPSFDPYKNSDHKFLCVSIRLDKARCRMSGHWKFNCFLLAEDDFRNQLELMIKQELTGPMMGNRWWTNLKHSIRSFAADYGRRLKSAMVAEQRSIKDKLDRVVLAGDSGQVNVAKAELTSLQIKKYQALVVRARLKRMSCEATNMAQELRDEELRHIASVTSPDGQRQTTNEVICREFRQYFLKLFTMEPGLSSAQFDTYLANFPCLSATEAAGCEGRIKKEEIREALMSVGLDKSPGIDGLPYEVYLRLSHMFVPLLATIYDNWMRQGTIPRRFTRDIVKLLCKNKHGEDGISNFRSLRMLNTDLKILAKILENRLQTVLPSLICPEQTCAVKGRTIQDSLYLVRTIVEKVDGNAVLINLDQSKAFDRVDHAFLEAVLSAAGFGLHFRTWIRLLYVSPEVVVEVNEVRLEPFTLTRSICQGCPLSPMLYILVLEPFLRKLKANLALRGLMLLGASEVARYTAYADNVSVLVMSSAEVEEVSKEIGRYEAVTGAKINREKSVSLRLGSWKGCALPGPFIWKDGPCKILGVWFGPDLQLEKNWSEVLEKVVTATELWLRRRLSLKDRAEVCCSHIYSLVVYRLSVLPIPPTILFKLERIVFQFVWAKRFPLEWREICHLHPSEGGLGVLNVEARRHTLRLTFLDRMCSRYTTAGSVWKEDAKQSFPSLRSVHSADGEAHCLPRHECPFYRECRHALKVLSQLQTGLSDSRPLSSRALYRLCRVVGASLIFTLDIPGM